MSALSKEDSVVDSPSRMCIAATKSIMGEVQLRQYAQVKRNIAPKTELKSDAEIKMDTLFNLTCINDNVTIYEKTQHMGFFVKVVWLTSSIIELTCVQVSDRLCSSLWRYSTLFAIPPHHQ